MEDKLCRIEEGLEKAGLLSRESLLKVRHLDYQKLPVAEAFDYIYLHGYWALGTPMHSGSGSYGAWAEQFVRVAKDLIRRHHIRSITDIGCGDFNVGRQLCDSVEKYNALDISTRIIELDRARFAGLANVTFQQANACTDALPKADLVIVRQVLQHLTNAQIEQILANIERTGFSFAVIAEHWPHPGQMQKPNADLESHGGDIRLKYRSGVLIDRPPFSRPAQHVVSLPGDNGQLAIYFWNLRADAPVATSTP
jgi:hypothetical protein